MRKFGFLHIDIIQVCCGVGLEVIKLNLKRFKEFISPFVEYRTFLFHIVTDMSGKKLHKDIL